MGRVAAGGEPHHYAFGLGRLWVSDTDEGTVVESGTSSRRVRARTTVGAAPHHVAVAGGRVLIAVNGTGRVAVVSRQGRTLGSIAVGAGPHGIAAVARPS